MKTTFLLLILFTTNVLMSQEFQGVAIYRSSQQVNVKTDSTQVSSANARELNALIKVQFDNEFKLQFNKTEQFPELLLHGTLRKFR